MTSFRAATIFLLLISVSAFVRAEEPIFRLPESATAFSVGDRVTLNGMPFRMLGFSSKEPARNMVLWFSKVLGAPLNMDVLGETLVLSKHGKDRHTTVQMELVGNGVQGVIAISDLSATRTKMAAYQRELERWLSAWPYGSRVLSDMTSEDQGMLSRHVVVSNSQTETINSNRLVEMLARDGYSLEREALADDASAPDRRSLMTSRTLYFRGKGKEAMATISRDQQGITITVLNTISSVGSY